MNLLTEVLGRNREEIGAQVFPYKGPCDYWSLKESDIRHRFEDGTIGFHDTYSDFPVFRAADLFAFPALARYLRGFESHPEGEATELNYRAFDQSCKFDAMELHGQEFCAKFTQFYQTAAERFCAMALAERANRMATIQRLSTQREAIRIESINDGWVSINGLKYHFRQDSRGLGGVNPGRFPKMFPGESPNYNSYFTVADFVPGTALLDLRHRTGWKTKGRINWVSLDTLEKAEKNVLARARTQLRKLAENTSVGAVHSVDESHALF